MIINRLIILIILPPTQISLHQNLQDVKTMDGSQVHDLVVVGAGPHALTFLCALLEKAPMDADLVDAKGGVTRSKMSDRAMRRRLMERKQKPPAFPPGLERVLVIDRYGTWLANWRRQFSFLGIQHLRSTGAVHPDPVDPEILFEFARWRGVSVEEGFEEITGVLRNKYFRGPFQTPKTPLFESFCDYLIDAYGLGDKVVKGEVVTVHPLPAEDEGGFGHRFEIELKGGEVVFAKRVVLSIGHCNEKRIPGWVEIDGDKPFQHQAMHVWDLVHKNPEDIVLNGKDLLIVGGGLTTAQLVEAGLRFGANHVHVVVRGEIKVRQFDSNLLWSGRLRHEKLSSFWSEESVTKKLQLITEARQGGTMPVEAEKKLRELQAEGYCSIVEYTEVWDTHWSSQSETFDVELSDGSRIVVGTIWLATGSTVDVEDDTIFSKLMETHPVELCSGYPILQQDLRWAPGWDIFVIGAYAALSIGPDAVNLSGARRAGFRVSNIIRGSL